jgi:FtsZ-binding cell division protein ZapB
MSKSQSIINELRSYLDDLASEVGAMQDQIKELHEKNERLAQQTTRLQQEKEQLAQQNTRLQQENKSLREEVTVVRLYQEVSEDEDFTTEDGGPTISRHALILYRELPAAFKFAEFFQIADEQGIDPAVARDALLQLLREDMLVQKGARIEKSEPGAGRFEVQKHMQPSRQ